MYLQPRERHKTIFVIIVQIRRNYRSARGHPYAVHFVLDVGAYIFFIVVVGLFIFVFWFCFVLFLNNGVFQVRAGVFLFFCGFEDEIVV